MVALTLCVMYAMELVSEWAVRAPSAVGSSGFDGARVRQAGGSAACEARVRQLLDPFWMVVMAFAVFAIGVAVFLFLWQTYARAKKVPCWVWGSPQTVHDPQHPRNEAYDDLDRCARSFPSSHLEMLAACHLS